MSTCLITEIKQQWATLVLGWRLPQCSTRVSEGFAACVRSPKPLLALFETCFKMGYTPIIAGITFPRFMSGKVTHAPDKITRPPHHQAVQR